MNETLARQRALNEPIWYVIRTKSNCEFKARDYLQSISIDCYLPTFLKPSRSSRVKDLIEQPAFSGYLFVSGAAYWQQRIPFMRTPGIVSILKQSNIPEAVEDSIVSNLRLVLTEGDQPVLYPYMKLGQTVTIIKGPLKGASGFIETIDKEKTQLIVSIHILGRSVAVSVGMDQVQIIE